LIGYKNKCGSHVGVVISFAIFVTFIIIIYTLASPNFRISSSEQFSVEYLETKLLENLSSEVLIITIDIENVIGTNCIEISNLLSDFDINRKIIVKNKEGILTPSVFTGSDSLQINRLDSGDDFFKIYASESFDELSEGSESCQSISEGSDFNFGSIKTENYFFESNFFDLMNSYSDYEVLKSDLNVPENSEFGFGLIYNNLSSVQIALKNVSKDIYIKEVPIQYIDSGGEISSGFLKIMVW